MAIILNTAKYSVLISSFYIQVFLDYTPLRYFSWLVPPVTLHQNIIIFFVKQSPIRGTNKTLGLFPPYVKMIALRDLTTKSGSVFDVKSYFR